MTNKPLVDTTRYRVYKALCRYAAKHGGNTPPMYRLVRILKPKMSYAMVRKCVNELIHDGLIERKDGEILIVDSTYLLPPRLRK